MDRLTLDLQHIRRALEAPAGGSSDYDLNPDAPRLAPRPLRPASVLVPLVERGGAVNLILTRRAALLKHHPGQVAFPGIARGDGHRIVEEADRLAMGEAAQ